MSDVILNKLNFTYDRGTKPVFSDLDLNLASGWTGITGANGCGKSTLLKLVSKHILPTSGQVITKGKPVYCEQSTEQRLPFPMDFLYPEDKKTYKIRGMLKIEDEWLNRYDDLSHGEKKRVQIAYALYQNPDILCVDEPTNHLDSHTRNIIMDTLKEFRGCGLIVSHDRELLDLLCARCLIIDQPDVSLYRGNYTETNRQSLSDKNHRNENYLKKQKQLKRHAVQKNRYKSEVAASAKKISKKSVAKKDFDSKLKIDGYRLQGKDKTTSIKVRHAESKISKIRDEIKSMGYRKSYATGIKIYTGKIRKDYLLLLEKGFFKLSEHKNVTFDTLTIKPDSRIGVTGKNGAGKSTLIRFIQHHLNIQNDKVFYLPQEIETHLSEKKLSGFKKMNKDRLGQIMTIMRRLGSDPKRVMETDQPSPGEIRKLMIADGLLNEPWLVILDEPTNHLDIVSVESLEETLGGINCALLLVSHDRYFMGAICKEEWNIESGQLIKKYF